MSIPNAVWTINSRTCKTKKTNSLEQGHLEKLETSQVSMFS